MNIKGITRAIEVLSSRKEIHYTDEPYIRMITKANEDTVLEGIRPFLETNRFRRFHEDVGYLETRIFLPYILDSAMKSQRGLTLYYKNKCMEYSNRVDNYNNLPWYKRLFKRV